MDDDQKEILKVGAETALQPFANLIEKLFGGAVEEIGGAWRDKFAVRRQIRQICLFKRLQAAIDDAGFEPRQIPDHIWIPALQEASLQDDEVLQECWANLLANAADPRQTSPVLPSFSSMLKDLTTREVRFLDLLYKDKLNDLRRSQLDIGYTREDLLAIYANCTKKALYFENAQLADVESLISRLNQAGMTVTFTSIVRRALADYLTKQTTAADEADGLFS